MKVLKEKNLKRIYFFLAVFLSSGAFSQPRKIYSCKENERISNFQFMNGKVLVYCVSRSEGGRDSPKLHCVNRTDAPAFEPGELLVTSENCLYSGTLRYPGMSDEKWQSIFTWLDQNKPSWKIPSQGIQSFLISNNGEVFVGIAGRLLYGEEKKISFYGKGGVPLGSKDVSLMRNVRISDNGKSTIVNAGKHGLIKFTGQGKEDSRLDPHFDFALSGDGARVAGFSENRITVYEHQSNRFNIPLKFVPRRAVFSGDGKRLVVAGRNVVYIFDLTRRALVNTINVPPGRKVQSLAICPGDERIVVGCIAVLERRTRTAKGRAKAEVMMLTKAGKMLASHSFDPVEYNLNTPSFKFFPGNESLLISSPKVVFELKL